MEEPVTAQALPPAGAGCQGHSERGRRTHRDLGGASCSAGHAPVLGAIDRQVQRELLVGSPPRGSEPISMCPLCGRFPQLTSSSPSLIDDQGTRPERRCHNRGLAQHFFILRSDPLNTRAAGFFW
jgi:hypothetical protein